MAVRNFQNGYNCCQSVVMAYADLFDLDPTLAATISSSFGGGMGRLREVCGAVSGMFMVLGLRFPAIDVQNKNAKLHNYQLVQQTAAEFKQEMGSYICADLLKIKHQPDDPHPSERTQRYYELRPCMRCIAMAAEIVGNAVLPPDSDKNGQTEPQSNE